MELFNLDDLILSGVKWELKETSNQPEKKSESNNEIKNMTIKNSPVIPITEPVKTEFAKEQVKNTETLAELCKMIGEFNHPLKNFAKTTILPELNINNGGLLIITDMPSASDEENGGILSDQSGEMIEKMLKAIGLARNDISITPLIFHRTPGGRSITDTEFELNRPFVEKLIHLLRPDAILTLGALSANKIANTDLAKTHGQVLNSEYGMPVIPIYHPNYLLLKPTAKKDVWDALQILQNLLKSADK